MNRAVTVIPASTDFRRQNILNVPVKRRAAAYARVSTDEEEQINSYDAQVRHYTEYIQENDSWEFVGMYADKDRSGTTTKRRDDFNRMINDALGGKIDLIITKSVSRFARNTVDSLTTIRQLKEKGVECYFEKEQIWTFDGKGELLLTIMSSLAQEESRSISENVTWGQRKRMQDGKLNLPYKQFLGYEKGADGLPKIVESEAKVIRLIYTLFLQGRTVNAIARHLTDEGILTPSGKEKWSVSTVLSILQNEKYKGKAILQKAFTVDFLTKKKKKNEGEIPQYHIENSHPAIIEPEMHDLVQVELKKRKSNGRHQSGLGCFSSKIICGDCGIFYGSKVWHSNSPYRRTIWRCNHKYNGGGKCGTPHLYEADVQKAFIQAFNMLFSDRERIVEDYAEIMRILTDTSVLDKEAAAQQSECDVTMELMRKCVEENASVELNQNDYAIRYNALVERYEAAKKRLDEIVEDKQARLVKRDSISRFIADLERRGGLLTEFDEALWYEVVESMTVHSDSEVAVIFKDGSEVRVETRGKITM